MGVRTRWAWIVEAVRQELSRTDQGPLQLTAFKTELLDLLNGTAAVAIDRADAHDREARLIDAVMTHVRAHYGEHLTTGGLAQLVGLSRAALCAQFVRFTGRTLHEFINTIRLSHAVEMVARGDKVEAVALLSGYRSKVTLYRHFVEATGVTPAEFRRRQASAPRAPGL